MRNFKLSFFFSRFTAQIESKKNELVSVNLYPIELFYTIGSLISSTNYTTNPSTTAVINLTSANFFNVSAHLTYSLTLLRGTFLDCCGFFTKNFLHLIYIFGFFFVDKKITLQLKILQSNLLLVSIQTLQFASIWAERELVEFTNIYLVGAYDTRKLLLDYSSPKGLQTLQTYTNFTNYHNNYYDYFRD